MAWPLPDPRKTLENDRVAVVPTDIAAHGRDLFKAACLQTNGEDLFVYHPGVGPFVDEGPFLDYLRVKTTNPAELLYTVIRRNAGVVGMETLVQKALEGKAAEEADDSIEREKGKYDKEFEERGVERLRLVR